MDLIPSDDPEDGVAIASGDLVVGKIDFIGDSDYFLLDLEEGETPEIRVESMNIDVQLAIDFPESEPDQVLGDDDGVGGLSGTNSKLIYRPIQAGVHYLVVNDLLLVNTGWYFVSLNPAPPDAIAVQLPPSYETVESPFGLMSVFKTLDPAFQPTHPPIGRLFQQNFRGLNSTWRTTTW